MPSNKERKYQRVISYIEDTVGADVNRDLLKVALSEQDISPLVVSTPADEELRVKLYGIGPDGNLNGAEVLSLNGTLDDAAGVQATYLARALASKGMDQFLSKMTDSQGNVIDPMTDDALASVGDDEIRVVSPNPLDVSASEVDVDINSQSLDSIATDIAAALKTNDTDELVVRVTDSGGTEVNPLTDQVTTSVANDAVRTSVINDEAQDYAVSPIYIEPSEIWEVDKNETLTVTDATVDGILIVKGTLEMYGDLKGSGRVTGDGSVVNMEVP